MKRRSFSLNPRTYAFTLVELLVSMTILSILLMLVARITSQTSSVWRSTTSKADQFREASDAFESLERNLAQATLNTYLDYYDENNQRRNPSNASSFIPVRYGRYSDLRFQVGKASDLIGGMESIHPCHGIFFMAPLGFSVAPTNDGLDKLLNTWGYYLEFRPDADRPSFISGPVRYRYRLMEFMQPTESLNIYDEPAKWIDLVSSGANSHVVASNIIAMIILPKLPSKGQVGNASIDIDGDKLAPNYVYDSATKGEGDSARDLNSLHQLPPVVEITMVAIDEISAAMLEDGATPPDFGLDKLFLKADPDSRREDLRTLQERLVEMKVMFRVFTTEVSIRGAKWSRE